MIQLDKKLIYVPVCELDSKSEELANDGWSGGALDNELQGKFFYKD